jgi:hypothetical protein
MRRIFSAAITCIILVSCGFGAASDDTSNAPPGNPDDNSRPILPGEQLTGIFVSSSKGVADADGSMAKPYKTLKDAIAVGLSTQQRVIACAEDYVENVELPDGVSIFGNFDCKASPWAPANARAVVRSTVVPALSVKDAQHKMRVDGFEFIAPNADQDANKNVSSVAALIMNAADLTLGNVVLTSGDGLPGVDGTDGAAPQELNAPTATQGVAASKQAECKPNPPIVTCSATPYNLLGALGGTSKCATGIMTNGGPGGRGGQGQYIAAPPPPGGACTPPAGYVAAGLPDTPTQATNEGGLELQPGADGLPGNDGADDNVKHGFFFDATGFRPGDGKKGGDGSSGQGGGGSGGNHLWNAGSNNNYCQTTAQVVNGYWTSNGAGGGAGGCPGIAGTPGTGGGASIGALVFKSKVTWELGEIHTGKGGRSGKGTLGSNGLPGGSGGTGSGDTNGGTQKGGSGGAGGSAGISGHGAAGPSYGMASSNTTIIGVNKDFPMTVGAGGDGQPALQKVIVGGATHSAPEADTGPSERTYEFVPVP